MTWTAIPVAQKRLVARTVRRADRGAHRGTIRAFAEEFGRSVRTIERWVKKFGVQHPGRARPGPAPVAVSREARQGIFIMLCTLGVRASEQLIKQLHATATFSVIRDMKRRFKAVCKKRVRRGKSTLTWCRAGGVWAIDFTKPDATLPPGTNRLLMIRDLASGFRLATIAIKGERADHVIQALEQLFAIFGAPLVLKHDNGGAFTSPRTQDVLAEHGVRSLASPVRMPEYNGSIERSLGWDKERIEQVALSNGRPGRWTLEDIEQARTQANVTLMPRNLKGLTPKQAFDQRRLITSKEREAFQETVHLGIQDELSKRFDESGTLVVDVAFETLERRAIMRALLKHRYLKIRRGRISTPFQGAQPDNNS